MMLFTKKTHRPLSRERKVFGIQTIANNDCMAWLLLLILRVNNLCISKLKQINRNSRYKWSMVTHWIIIFAWKIGMFAWKCLFDNIYLKLWFETRSFRLLYQSTWNGMDHTHERSCMCSLVKWFILIKPNGQLRKCQDKKNRRIFNYN